MYKIHLYSFQLFWKLEQHICALLVMMEAVVNQNEMGVYQEIFRPKRTHLNGISQNQAPKN